MNEVFAWILPCIALYVHENIHYINYEIGIFAKKFTFNVDVLSWYILSRIKV